MVFAKKSLGQNFLNNTYILKKIVTDSEISKDDIVLEIGPGTGNLTREILSTGAHVFAIEKDDRLINILPETFNNYVANNTFTLIHGDILEIEIKDIFLNKKPPAKKSQKINYKLIANIPYYITGAIIRKFLECEESLQPSLITILVQKEVAERIIARDKKESILSIFVKAYCTPVITQKVARGNFFPIPNVDSAVITFKHISKILFQKYSVSETSFASLVHAGFAHKRKLLLKNLATAGYNIKKLETAFEKIKLDKKIRAEDIQVETWMSLTAALTVLQ